MQQAHAPILFLGTGIMGAPMVRRLEAAGYDVEVWNRSADKAEALASENVAAIKDLMALAPAVRTVILMVSTGAVVDELLFGEDGTGGLQGMLAPGSTVIVMSSIPVQSSRAQAEKLKAHGIAYLDAPVSGGEKGAIEGTLSIMVGGEGTRVDESRPALEAMGRVIHIGPNGCGQLAKLANQTIVGITIGAVSEALLLAKAGGADLAAVREALLGGFARSEILSQHGQRMIDGNFTPGAKSEVQLKDANTALGLADELGVETPLLTEVAALYAELCKKGGANLDHSALYKLLDER
ncbi:NAD(P)-dependent oxidoreductase [Alterisphingorhabdus coralli]|uniref:NAD(P)-dependent oxidoreductase n=1 Tax=Alterisphingorhabdus coralli TaxID=3071408 RepID=A0AA97I1P1_9SPHN|nr:NAD(P)-dependent oxidoreductase [Parasphingorhabdus sp. SCSIO 66989]WOE75495.1 NAD(P)-dependent oxidoreductase [Parasphingorhabdus sp. SCSIO 66989]